ncbi:hypothetical protein FDJ25_gp021 [Vibrio phage Aphrodite1]|uniref:Uncharacterized protein n=1 Tax=Vibrio phage Aphrodite1 TaxID=2070057 RepID=A0A2I7QI26_9CAUD|nr:hypothetical protein FDJ25_gp021 [Vibrio phage Aphrodite1]AUR81050.1 hypothetical protein Aphrodite1_0189 [Vibrio phage Aphrodite1]
MTTLFITLTVLAFMAIGLAYHSFKQKYTDGPIKLTARSAVTEDRLAISIYNTKGRELYLHIARSNRRLTKLSYEQETGAYMLELSGEDQSAHEYHMGILEALAFNDLDPKNPITLHNDLDLIEVMLKGTLREDHSRTTRNELRKARNEYVAYLNQLQEEK